MRTLRQLVVRVPIRMMALIATLASALIATLILKRFYFVPDTEELRVVGSAAGNEGYDIFQRGTRLTKIATEETILAYATIALSQNGQLIQSCAIDLAMDDVVKLIVYKFFCHHNLVSNKKFKRTDKIQVAAEQIATEVGCGKLDIAPTGSSAG